MNKNVLRYFLNGEYALASALVLVFVWFFVQLTEVLSGMSVNEETSWLNPIVNRIDFVNIEDVSLDAIFAIKDMEFSDPRIVIVNIGAVSPAPDGKIARMLYKLQAYGARVVGIDVIYDSLHFDRFPPMRRGEITLIKQAFTDVHNVVLVTGYDPDSLTQAITLDPDVLTAVHHYGFANLEADDDEVVRRFRAYRTIDGKRELSLPISMLALYEPALVQRVLALPEDPQIISYCGSYDQFQTVPIDDVIETDVYRNLFRGAVVLVGYVNEGGFVYLNDTHKTPIGRKVGIEGPDMPGILIHANILNMMLRGTFITPVPVWFDWALTFLLSYFSIAMYRVLRTKAVSGKGVAMLITVNLITETVVVFFLPIIAYFYFGVKISYNLMATAVLLFIPTNALSTKARMFALRLLAMRHAGRMASPVALQFPHAFDDDASFPADMRLIHSALSIVHLAVAHRAAAAYPPGTSAAEELRLSEAASWRMLVPEIDALCRTESRRADQWSYFFRYLEGRKRQLMRESGVRDLLFHEHLGKANEFFYLEEWEIILPFVRALYHSALVPYLAAAVILRENGGSGEPRWLRVLAEKSVAWDATGIDENRDGLYLHQQTPPQQLIRLSPLCEIAECKVHRTEELFVFAGAVPRQFGLGLLPVYYGPTLSCEPVLPEWTLDELKRMGVMPEGVVTR